MSATYLNLCARSGGSNMNAGTLTGDTTVPGTAAAKTYTGGDSAANAASFTATGGSDMTEAVAGRYACLCVDGDTTPTSGQYVIAKITSVAGTTINLSTTERVSFGSVLGSGSGNRTLRIGGAWLGPQGSNHTPFTLGLNALSSTAPARANLKNDQTYAVTVNLSINGSNSVGNIRGFTTSYGDGGKATIDGGNSGSAYILCTFGSSGDICNVQDIIFNRNGASSDAQLVQISSNGVFFKGCVFSNSRGNGVSNSLNCTLIECEIFGNNASNSETAGIANFSTIFIVRCTIHDNAGSNTNGIRNAGNCSVFESIIESNGKHGIENVGSGAHMTLVRCDIYNNASTGITSASATIIADSCNFLKNSGAPLAGPSSGGLVAYTINCAYGSGTQVNGAAASNYVIEESLTTYSSGVQPWTDPANGDFTVDTSGPAVATGRGVFTATAAGYSATTSAPCRSASQAAGGTTPDYPSAGDVRNGVSYDSGGLTGTLVVPSSHDVRFGTAFGTASGLTGALVLPAQSDVRSGTDYGYSAEFTGTLVAGTSGGGPLVGHGGLVL